MNFIDEFIKKESSAGITLIFVTIFALLLKNSPLSQLYEEFLLTPVEIRFGALHIDKPLLLWINDGLMAIFFFMVGLEIKREIITGELSDPKAAALPVVAAVGGMLVPVGLYLAVTAGKPAAVGWGIPMATDIAFVVGCLAVLGQRIPGSLRVLLLSLAIADDIGAILVIAIGEHRINAGHRSAGGHRHGARKALVGEPDA